MKYSGFYTWLGAFLLFILAQIYKDKPITNSTIYFVGVIILITISLTLSFGEKQE